MTKANFYRQRLADVLSPLDTRSEGQCSTQIKQFLLVQKVEISLKGFTLGVKAEIEKKKKKNRFNLPPMVTNKLMLSFLRLVFRLEGWKKDIASNWGSQFATNV
jgi:hypothetical protein